MSARTRIHAITLAHLVFGLGCGDAQRAGVSACGTPAPLATIREAITAGASHSLIGLSARDMNAVVLVKLTAADQRKLCSGVLVAKDRVLSAAHCLYGLERPSLEVVLGPSEPAAVHRSGAEIVATRQNYDLLLLALDHPVPAAIASPLRVALSTLGTPELGVIAGFGLDAELMLGARLFALADIVAADAIYYNTSAGPASGACIGDSGGPLLWRDETGAPVVLAVLSNGHASCHGEDHYTRLDAVSDWLGPLLAGVAYSSADCGSLGAEGLCAGPLQATWCEGKTLASQTCSGGSACGWDERTRGFRCVDPAHDSCAGHTEFGICRDGAAVRCDDGVLDEVTCCGEPCGRDPGTGRATCG